MTTSHFQSLQVMLLTMIVRLTSWCLSLSVNNLFGILNNNYCTLNFLYFSVINQEYYNYHFV